MVIGHSPTRNPQRAFTLLEILLASAAAALILAAVYGVFVHAMRLRDGATARVRDTRLRARAERAIRDDLQNALVSGGALAASLTGGSNQNGPGGAGLPGYLKLASTTGRMTGADAANSGSATQQVEYYLTRDADAAPAANGAPAGGTLVRAVTRDLLATPAPTPAEERVFSGVQALQVQFYDGTAWQDNWQYDGAAAAAATGGTTTGNPTLPQAVRVDVQPVPAKDGGNLPPPIEVLVQWTTQPFAVSPVTAQ